MQKDVLVFSNEWGERCFLGVMFQTVVICGLWHNHMRHFATGVPCKAGKCRCHVGVRRCFPESKILQMTLLHHAHEKAFFLEWAPRDPKLFSFSGGVMVRLSLNQSRRMSKWVVLTQEPQGEKEKLDVTEDGFCNVLCDALLPPPFPSLPPSLIPFRSSHPSPFPSSLSLPSLPFPSSSLTPSPPHSFSPPLPFEQFSLSSAAQHQPDTRVGALVVHHPGCVTTPVGLDRTPTVHWGRYDGRPWVARTTQYAIAGDVFFFSFACDVFSFFSAGDFLLFVSFLLLASFLSCGGVVFMCQRMLLTLPLCFSSLPMCVCVCFS